MMNHLRKKLSIAVFCFCAAVLLAGAFVSSVQAEAAIKKTGVLVSSNNKQNPINGVNTLFVGFLYVL